jgi:ATP-dependent protease HslVU (ClpYQ) peptidase subunit
MCSGGLLQECRKLVKAGRYWYGQAGTATDSEFVRMWLEAGADVSGWPDDLELEDQIHGLAVHARTKIVYIVEGSRPVLIRCWDTCVATGSGRDFALSAMRMGKVATEAVEFAAQFDIYTGNGVDSVEIRKRPRARRK